MTMLPIFMFGVLIGILISYSYNMYNQNIPSNTKIRLQEKEIERQTSDNEMLHNLIDKLYNKIDKLEQELNEYKK